MRIREQACDSNIKISKFQFNCDECDKSIPNPLPQNLNHFLMIVGKPELQQAQQQPRSARLLPRVHEETGPSLAEQLQEGTPTPDRERRADRRNTFIQDGPMGTEPFMQRGDDPFEQAQRQERQSVARLTSRELEEATRP